MAVLEFVYISGLKLFAPRARLLFYVAVEGWSVHILVAENFLLFYGSFFTVETSDLASFPKHFMMGVSASGL